MKFLDYLERKIRRVAIPDLVVYIIIGQVIAFFLSMSNPQALEIFMLTPRLVLQGEVWRLVSFLFLPPMMHPIFAFFFWYLMYMFGSAVQGQWGVARFNLYLLIGYIANVSASFLLLDQPAANGFLYGTIFFAFAVFYPDFELRLMFILPVKVKWLALLAAFPYVSSLLFGPMMNRVLAVASVLNFLLFFWPDFVSKVRYGHRKRQQKIQRQREKNTPRHVCTVCGINNLDAPKMQFRYCSKCDGGKYGYCMDHLNSHDHIQSEENSASS